MSHATEECPYLDDEPQYVDRGTAAAVVEGNGFTWTEPIWLPDLVAADLVEAHVIELVTEGRKWPGGTLVNEFRLLT